MDANISENTFKDFGEDALYPFPRKGLSCVEGRSPEQLRSQVRQYVPPTPGVYGMINMLGRLIYVGKSKSLRNRLLSYFLPGNEEDKSGRIVQSTACLVWETQPSEFAALIREQQLIRQFQPRFNVQGVPKRHQAVFICLGKSPAEQFYVARLHDPSALVVLGPLHGATRAHRAVEVLNRHFLLRDCSSKQSCSFSEQLQLFDIELRPGCIRLEIGSCLGPCVSACSRQDYQGQIQRASDYLQGKDKSILESLETSMFQLALSRQFEQAVSVREDLYAVKWLTQRITDICTARNRYTFVYRVKSAANATSDTSEVWYLIRGGVVEGALAAPRNQRQRELTQQLLQSWWTQTGSSEQQFSPRPETLAIVASWFRNHRAELHQTFTTSELLALESGHQSYLQNSSRVCAS